MPKVSEFPHLAPTTATKVPVIGETHFLVGDLDVLFETRNLLYRAVIYQAGTDAPVAAVLANNFGFLFEWQYSGDPGEYYFIAPSNAFVLEKTYLTTSLSKSNPAYSASIVRISANFLRIYTWDGSSPSDSIMGGTDLGLAVEIRVVP
jgi:hypothetical protein